MNKTGKKAILKKHIKLLQRKLFLFLIASVANKITNAKKDKFNGNGV